jgi:hypothetical protein
MIDETVNIDNSNCLTWTLSDPAMAISDKQIPRLKIINNKLRDTGLISVDVPIDQIIKYQEFSKFVLEISQAARMTDALLNSSSQQYFLNLLDSNDRLITLNDDTGIPGGFLSSIDKILYLADNKETALDKILNLINEPEGTLSLLTLYKTTFLNFYKHT